MTMRNYADIRTYEELTASLNDLQREIGRKESMLASRYEDAKAFYSPSNMAAMIARQVMSSIDWVAIALKAIRKLKSALEEKKD